jgi:membrane associated rhomboid family serine protease
MVSATVILLLTFVTSTIGFKKKLFRYVFSCWSRKITHIWRLFTYTFVHLNPKHLIWHTIFYSMGFLGFFQQFGNWEFIKFYFLSGIISAIPFHIMNSKHEVHFMNGNSGVVYAILFAMITKNAFVELDLIFFKVPVYALGLLLLVNNIFGGIVKDKNSMIAHTIGILFGICWGITH